LFVVVVVVVESYGLVIGSCGDGCFAILFCFFYYGVEIGKPQSVSVG
jgi:hypothetical protein